MNQSGIPLSYDNLKKYNSHLPFPRFNLEQQQVKDPIVEPPKVYKQETHHQHEEYKRPTVAPNPYAENSKSLDDFDDFIDPTNDQAQPPSQSPQVVLTEEERQKLEMEERMKRFDLLSSVFEDALIEEDPTKAKPKKEDSKVTPTPTVPQNVPQVAQTQNKEINREAGEDDWDDFAFAEGQTPQKEIAGFDIENTQKQDQDVWTQNEALPNEGTATAVHNDDSFDDFAEPQHSDPQIEEVPMEVDQKVAEVPQSSAAKEEFPSFFDEKTTPRVNIEMTDIRMSFPSQEMWSSNLASNNKDNSNFNAEDKIDWSSAGQGFTSSNFKLDSKQNVITEEDEFGDIMKLKDAVATKPKQSQLEDSFEDFADAEPTAPVTQKAQPKKLKPLPLRLNKPVANEDAKNWGSFKFEEADSKSNQPEAIINSSWTNTPSLSDNSVKKPETNDFYDPFAEIMFQPPSETFETPNENVTTESAVQDTPKDSNKDDDSDFDDFMDPNEAAQEDSSQSSPNFMPPKLESESSDFESKPNFYIKHLPDPKKIEEDSRAFEESDFIGGFMKTVISDSNKHAPNPAEPVKEVKVEVKKSDLPRDDGLSKQSLTNQIERSFGDSGYVDFYSSSGLSQSSIDSETLEAKIEDSDYMQQVSGTLIKIENYEGAKKVIEHINLLALIQKYTADKNKAAAEEQYEVAKTLRDEIINLKSKLLTPAAVLSFVSANNDHKQPTLKSLLNQVVYRVDDWIARYFIPKVLEDYKAIPDRDFDRKIHFKKEVMINSLILLKISKIKIENYKQNWDEFVPFLFKEIEANLVILNEIKSLEPDVIAALREEDKFTVFLKGLKVLFQIVSNIHTSLDIIDKVDTDFAIDIEVYWQQAKQCLQSWNKIMSILDSAIGVPSKQLAPQIMSEKVLSDEAKIDDGFLSIQRDKYSNMCSLCWAYISSNEGKTSQGALEVPERWLEFNNTNEEQQTYHNYCINLWINKISRNPY